MSTKRRASSAVAESEKARVLDDLSGQHSVYFPPPTQQVELRHVKVKSEPGVAPSTPDRVVKPEPSTFDSPPAAAPSPPAAAAAAVCPAPAAAAAATVPIVLSQAPAAAASPVAASPKQQRFSLPQSKFGASAAPAEAEHGLDIRLAMATSYLSPQRYHLPAGTVIVGFLSEFFYRLNASNDGSGFWTGALTGFNWVTRVAIADPNEPENALGKQLHSLVGRPITIVTRSTSPMFNTVSGNSSFWSPEHHKVYLFLSPQNCIVRDGVRQQDAVFVPRCSHLSVTKLFPSRVVLPDLLVTCIDTSSLSVSVLTRLMTGVSVITMPVHLDRATSKLEVVLCILPAALKLLTDTMAARVDSDYPLAVRVSGAVVIRATSPRINGSTVPGTVIVDATHVTASVTPITDDVLLLQLLAELRNVEQAIAAALVGDLVGASNNIAPLPSEE